MRSACSTAITKVSLRATMSEPDVTPMMRDLLQDSGCVQGFGSASSTDAPRVIAADMIPVTMGWNPNVKEKPVCLDRLRSKS